MRVLVLTVDNVMLLRDVQLAGAEVRDTAEVDLAVQVVGELPVAHLFVCV